MYKRQELGFIGAVLIIVLFVLFIVQGLLIAYKAENLYCTMVGIGIMAVSYTHLALALTA